jgi:hypothetical protein
LNESAQRAILAKLICRIYGWKFTLSVEEGFHYAKRGGWGSGSGWDDDEFMTWEAAALMDLDTWPQLGD